MKGLFPTAQLGAHYLNANNNNNHHNHHHNHIRHVPVHTPSRHHHNNNQDVVMLCSKCGESIEPSGMTSRTWLAATTNCICILLMYGAAYVVNDLEHDYRSAASSAAGTTAIKKPILISLAVFLFCAVSHLVIAHDIVGMSLRRMLFWGTNVGAAGAASAIILCTICFPHLRAGRWLMAMHFAMWGWTVALSAVYVFEALRLHRMPKKESECTEARNEKAAFVMTE